MRSCLPSPNKYRSKSVIGIKARSGWRVARGIQVAASRGDLLVFLGQQVVSQYLTRPVTTAYLAILPRVGLMGYPLPAFDLPQKESRPSRARKCQITGLTCQMRSAYSRMQRSLEK